MNNSLLSITRNIQESIRKLKDSTVTNILFHEDTHPTFDKSSVPFHFLYCFDVIFITDMGNLILSTIQTEDGLETLWIDSISEIEKDLKVLKINSKIKNVFVENSTYDYPFKLEFEFEQNILILYAAEIYDEVNKQLRYSVNDEMILAFLNKVDADRFESLINYG